ncbi:MULTISPECIES: citrulline utilization hydrolase CtlX [Brenneria]|uniref:Amidinotransferase n=1 Tax=Brenneria nigrifluens DSM 30175 = ATCC 13028 TaxID=1121120 RepID=A0A2U1USW5_9GAMM|nr:MULTISPECIES: arginine deiminase-related protein [Brenneria]EHD21715.1 amidinotransferase [Brenneria sp. EniD312]PWC24749.1 amidinotransferase [Brenneria nigrifluens] [Brenneria nigrifluens DSM 30175 = ATCC 13028]QCR04828.1 amidinotransferase [Brenneria nigrifluens] [Brenneria nigrifluens DSM 30175 = ATCC 13028]
MQTTDTVFMVRPSLFKVNEETALSNYFQKTDYVSDNIQQRALAAFDSYVDELKAVGVNVIVFEDDEANDTPDSIFPNNWITLDSQGRVIIYPMEAENRRRERRKDIIDNLAGRFDVKQFYDISHFEKQNKFLEGTGSLVCDHEKRIAYVCHSSRSSPEVMAELQKITGYQAVWFHAYDQCNQPIYHTNVMMSVGKKYAVVCLDAITDNHEAQQVKASLTASGKTIIAITHEQMKSFCANMLELKSVGGVPVFAMSTQAWDAFSAEQKALLADYAKIVRAPIGIIETLGGGGARCMIAEIFLDKKEVNQSDT